MVPQLPHLKCQFLLSTMAQRRFNALGMLNSSKSHVDKLLLVKVSSGFGNSRPNRRTNFEVFTEVNLKLMIIIKKDNTMSY